VDADRILAADRPMRENKSLFNKYIALIQKNILLSSALIGCAPATEGERQMTNTAPTLSPDRRIAATPGMCGLPMRCRRFV
jgi:hypothetical protein